MIASNADVRHATHSSPMRGGGGARDKPRQCLHPNKGLQRRHIRGGFEALEEGFFSFKEKNARMLGSWPCTRPPTTQAMP